MTSDGVGGCWQLRALRAAADGGSACHAPAGALGTQLGRVGIAADALERPRPTAQEPESWSVGRRRSKLAARPTADSAGGVHGIDHDEAAKAYVGRDGRGGAGAVVGGGHGLGGAGRCHGVVVVVVVVVVFVGKAGASLWVSGPRCAVEREG